MLRRHARAGFTLIELLIVVALLAILLALAMPSFDAALKRYRIGMAANQIAGALQFARTEAIRTRNNVTITQVDTPVDVGCTSSGTTDWHCGVDVTALDDNAKTTVLKTISTSNLHAVNVQMSNTDSKDVITFSPIGFAADCAACNGVAASDSFIYVWPFSSGNNVNTPGIAVSTVCVTRAGKVRVVPQYVTDSANCA